MFIKLRMVDELKGLEFGSLLLSVDSIEVVEEYGNPYTKGSRLRLKAVVNGFDSNDRPYKMQNEYWVAESVDTIFELIAQASKGIVPCGYER